MRESKTTVFIATSLDGFIAREDGGIDWLNEIPDAPGEDYGYAVFMGTVDAARPPSSSSAANALISRST